LGLPRIDELGGTLIQINNKIEGLFGSVKSKAKNERRRDKKTKDHKELRQYISSAGNRT